jgi:hypothetical protein
MVPSLHLLSHTLQTSLQQPQAPPLNRRKTPSNKSTHARSMLTTHPHIPSAKTNGSHIFVGSSQFLFPFSISPQGSVCFYADADWRVPREHIAKHTRPEGCRRCSKQFSTKYVLKRHEKTCKVLKASVMNRVQGTQEHLHRDLIRAHSVERRYG